MDFWSNVDDINCAYGGDPCHPNQSRTEEPMGQTKKQVKKYNTMFDVAFTVTHSYKDPSNVPVPMLIDALEERVKFLRNFPEDAAEAFGICDTYEED